MNVMSSMVVWLFGYLGIWVFGCLVVHGFCMLLEFNFLD